MLFDSGIALPVAVADAAPPEHFSLDISESLPSDDLTEACGTEVIISISGTARITLWRNEAGIVVRELDRAPGFKITYSAPASGASVKHPEQLGVDVELRRRCDRRRPSHGAVPRTHGTRHRVHPRPTLARQLRADSWPASTSLASRV